MKKSKHKSQSAMNTYNIGIDDIKWSTIDYKVKKKKQTYVGEKN